MRAPAERNVAVREQLRVAEEGGVERCWSRVYWVTKLPVCLVGSSFSTRPRVGPLGLPNVALPFASTLMSQHASSNMLTTLPPCIWTSCCQWNWAFVGSANVLSFGLPLSVHWIASWSG